MQCILVVSNAHSGELARVPDVIQKRCSGGIIFWQLWWCPWSLGGMSSNWQKINPMAVLKAPLPLIPFPRFALGLNSPTLSPHCHGTGQLHGRRKVCAGLSMAMCPIFREHYSHCISAIGAPHSQHTVKGTPKVE